MFFLITPAFFWNAMYIYFFHNSPEAYAPAVEAGLYMVVFISQFVISRYWVEQYLVAGALGIAFVAMGIFSGTRNLEYFSFALWVVTTHVVLWWLRRDFVATLHSRRENLSKSLPPRVASFMAVCPPSTRIEDVFQARHRPCVCVSADWRSFQKTAAGQDPEYVSEILESYHNQVVRSVERHFPDRNFYIDWVADEIFIILYSDTDDSHQIRMDACEFLAHFATDLRESLEGSQFVPTFDIGASYGVGYIGMIGPTSHKKATAIGEVGGVAKRLESAAKTWRKESPNVTSSSPVLAIDSKLHETFQSSESSKLNFFEISSSTKDLENHKVFVFHAGQKSGNSNLEKSA